MCVIWYFYILMK